MGHSMGTNKQVAVGAARIWVAVGGWLRGPVFTAGVLVLGFHSLAQTDEPFPASDATNPSATSTTAMPFVPPAPMIPAGTGVPPMTTAPVNLAGPSLAAANDMIGFTRELATGNQAITLINASRKWMAVYHVDQAGQIHLVSSRPLDADFSFQFNATAPLPEEIRRLQGR